MINNLYNSLVGPVGVFVVVARRTHRVVGVVGRHYPLPSNHADYHLVFPQDVLHLLLDYGVMLQQILKVFLAVSNILLYLLVISSEFLISL